MGCFEPFVSVCDLFERQAEACSQSPAVVFGELTLTYAEVNAASNHIAWRIAGGNADIPPNPYGFEQRPVVVLLGMCPAGIIAAMAVLKSGQIYVPLDPSDSPNRVESILSEVDPVCLIVDTQSLSQWRHFLPQQAAVINVDTLNLRGACPNLGLTFAPDSLACVIYTSGSTGCPKGVIRPHKSLVHDALIRSQLMGVTASDRIAMLSWATGQALSTLILPLIHGAVLVPVPIQRAGLPQLVEKLSAKAITILVIASPLLRALMHDISDRLDLPHLRLVRIASDRSFPEDVVCFRQVFPLDCKLMNGLASSETGAICVQMIDDLTPLEGGVLPVGRAVIGKEVFILDDREQIVEPGVHGRIAVRSEFLALGYWGRPDLTDQTFRRDPLDSSQRLYLSGDFGYLRPDGSLVFLDRLDNQVRIRGLLVDCIEVQTILMSHPRIREAVVGSWGNSSDPHLVAWIVFTGSPLGSEELRLFTLSRLASHMVPSAFVAVNILPLTARGKLDRKALPAPSFSGNLQQRVAPSTDQERQLHAIWAEVLGHGEFGTSDNFFVIGGHSLAAARLMALIEQRFAMALPIATIFHAPQIAPMARLMENANATAAVGDPCLVPLQPHGEAAPLFVIHGYAGDVFCYTDFSRALAPHRPVYGLQAMGIDGTSERHGSVVAMAEHYANLIDQHSPNGVVHLLGQSAGGWYAWAVASELLRRGRSLGMVAILDSGPTAAISRRLRGSLLLRRSLRRVPVYALQLRHSKRPRNLLAFLRERRRKLASHLSRFSSDASSLPVQALQPSAVDEGGMDYFALLLRGYRPGSLPVRVHLLTSKHDPHLKNRLWRAMACRGVVVRQLFEEHHHFHTASHADQLAAAIAEILEMVEAA